MDIVQTRTPSFNWIIVKSVILGAFLCYAAFALVALVLVLAPASDSPRYLLIYDLTIYGLVASAIALPSMLIGSSLAQVITGLVLRPYEQYLRTTLDALSRYQSQAEWPGRQFLDLLRPSRLIESRREFLLLGLEATLPDLSEPTTHALDRLSSIVLVLEFEAIGADRSDLAEIAGKVRGYLHRVHNLIRFRTVILTVLRAAAPAAIAWLIADALFTQSSPTMEGLSQPSPAMEGLGLLLPYGKNVVSYLNLENHVDKEIEILKHLAVGVILLLNVPFVVYVVGQAIYIMTWGLAKRTTTALDDVLWMVVSWSLAGVIGGAVMMYAFKEIGSKPPLPLRGGFAIFRYLLLPPDREDKIKRKQDYQNGYPVRTTDERIYDEDELPPIPKTPPDTPTPSAEQGASEQNAKPDEDYRVALKKAGTPKKLRDFAKNYITNKVGETGASVLRVACIAWFTGMLILLLRALCGRVLRQMAARTEQRYDDMAVELINIFGTAILVAIGLGWMLLVTLGGGDSGGGDSGGGNSALLPFAILVAVAGTVMGIASRDLLVNFFAGVSLRIDKPFDVHERILLDAGAVCEVRSVGMRSTHFFNIIENTDIYIPNSELATKTVVNLSRPDREYRRVLSYWISDSHPMNLQIADRLLLLGAYSVEGIDTPTIRDEVSEGATFHRNRPGIAAEFAKLQDRYDECVSAMIKYHGSSVPVGDLVEDLCFDLTRIASALNRTRQDRWNSRKGITNYQFAKDLEKLLDAMRYEKFDLDQSDDPIAVLLRQAHQLSYKFYELSTCFYTLSSSYPAVRADLEQLVLEILRAPSVRSNHVISDDGGGVWKIDLIIYAQLTEQSDEILHHLNLFNQRVLQAARLLPVRAGADEPERKLAGTAEAKP